MATGDTWLRHNAATQASVWASRPTRLEAGLLACWSIPDLGERLKGEFGCRRRTALHHPAAL